MSEKYVVSIGKKHWNSSKRYAIRNKNTHWVMYFYDESGVFRTKRATFWDYIRYKLARNRVKVIKNDE